MNIRKFISLLEFLGLGIITYVILISPEEYMLKSILFFGILIVIESIYFSYEYFKLVRPKKIFLFQTRYSLNLDSILNLLVVIALITALIIKWNEIKEYPEYGLLFSIITTIRGAIFHKQKNAIRLDTKMILFDELFIKDLWVNEIKNAFIDHDKNNISLILVDNKKKILRLNIEFFNKEKERIEKVVDFINNAA